MKYLFFTLMLVACKFSHAQQENFFSDLDASPLDVVMVRDDSNKAIARVIYSRPSKRKRKVFGGLVSYGEVWRTGANEATEISFYQDVMIADQKIPAGSYSIFTIPNENEWTLILNTETTQWGTKYDASKMYWKLQLKSCHLLRRWNLFQ